MKINNIQTLLFQFVEREYENFVVFVINAKTDDKNIKIKIISIGDTFATVDVLNRLLAIVQS